MEKIKDQKKIEAYVNKHWKNAINIYKSVYVRKTDLKPVEYISYKSYRNQHVYTAKTLPELQLKLYNVLQEERGGKPIPKYIGCDGADLETMKAYIAKNHHRKIGFIKSRNGYETTYCGVTGCYGATGYRKLRNKDKNKLIQNLYNLYQSEKSVCVKRETDGRPRKDASKKDLSLAKDFSEIPELKTVSEEVNTPVSSEGNNISLTINKNGQSITVTGNNFGEIKNLLNNIASALALMEENK